MSVLRVNTFREPMVFVDIETNGLNHIRGRIIEIAVIRVEDGKVVRTVKTLLDPGTPLPHFITRLTGIHEGDLRAAPEFHQVIDELEEIFEGAIFVAHNVRFDYSFIKQEFARCGRTFLPKQLCTVKLSRALFPHEKGHKLEDLIRRYGFTYAKRHRAYDDAAVLWQFIQYASKHYPPEQIEAAVARQIRQPALPKNIDPELVKGLPDTSGVYIFEDAYGQPMYVGKSINIRKRVLSHFGRDHAESKEFKIAQSIAGIRVEETPGELSALLLESRLVKELQPVYNRKLRRVQKLMLARQIENEAGYLTILLEEADAIRPEDAGQVLAVYPRRGKAKQALEEVTRSFELCPKLVGLEKAGTCCFLYQLGKCRGACTGKESAEEYNRRLLLAFDRQRIRSWPYRGPILLSERSDDKHAFIIDRWCVLGEVAQEEHCEPQVKLAKKAFDLDTYKILQSFLASKLNSIRVQPMEYSQLDSLIAASQPA